MNQEQFLKLSAWAEKKGLFLHPNLERRFDQGVGGMYATANIEKGELLASIPVQDFFGESDHHYPESASRAARQIHAVCRASNAPDSADKTMLFANCYALDELEPISTFFCSPEELETLHTAAPWVASQVREKQVMYKQLIEGLTQFDSSISQSKYVWATLNYNARAIGTAGILPVLDCFNHHALKGEGIRIDEEEVRMVAGESLQAGDQAFISYGALDISKHAIHYNYYDPDGWHVIALQRVVFPAAAVSQAVFVELNARGFQIQLGQAGPHRIFMVGDSNAHFSSDGPSPRLLEFLSCITRQRDDLLSTLHDMLISLDQANGIDRMSKKAFKGRLSRFYPMLRKERQIIEANRAWLKTQQANRAVAN